MYLKLYCIVTIEIWLRINNNFNCSCLELSTACIFSLVFIVLNFRDQNESKYHSLVFSIIWRIMHCVSVI